MRVLSAGPAPGRSPAAPYARFLGLVAATSAVLAVAGGLPTARLGGTEGVAAMLAAIGVGFAASAVGALPIAWLPAGAAPDQAANAALAGLVVRLLVALLLGGLVAWGGWVARRPFLVWLAISYLAVLIVDTRYALKGVRRPAASEG